MVIYNRKEKCMPDLKQSVTEEVSCLRLKEGRRKGGFGSKQ